MKVNKQHFGSKWKSSDLHQQSYSAFNSSVAPTSADRGAWNRCGS